MITHRTSTSRPHEQTVIDMLRDDPEFLDEYLAVALDEIDQPGGQAARKLVPCLVFQGQPHH